MPTSRPDPDVATRPSTASTPSPLRPAVLVTRPGAARPGDVAKKSRDAFRTLSLTSVGLEMGIAVILGLLFGQWLDGKLGSEPWMMILFTAFGMAAGMKGVFRAVRQADRIAAENEAAAAAEAAEAARAKEREAR